MPRLAFISVRNGLVAGGLGFVFYTYALLYRETSVPVFRFTSIFGLSCYPFLWLWVLKELRDYHQHGLLSFGEGMISNLLFTTIFAGTASLLILIFMTLNPVF
ncbi:MAG: hypothetical protein U5K54_08520 [Cytophagales bacterium]|nr:hypothetical protein [Cytophagales bacterium]